MSDRPLPARVAIAALWGLAFLPMAGAAQGVSASLSDPRAYLVQMRCENPRVLPGDATCGALRPVGEDEDPGYRLNNGDDGAGRIDSINIPVTRNNKWRVVSPDVHVNERDPARQGGVSVEGVGARFLSVLGSWSPVALSRFANEQCPSMPDSSDRFLDAWVLGPSRDTDERVGHGTTRSNNLATAHGAACPARYHASAYTWEKRPFVYRWGRRFESLVSVHYSAAAPRDGGPGPAEQRERLYLAYGIGLARWEKWSREDWSDPKSGQSAFDQARTLFATRRCNRPVEDADQGDGVKYAPVTSDGVFAETITAGPGQAPRVWYLTRCEDYTHLIAGPATVLIRRAADADSLFWR